MAEDTIPLAEALAVMNPGPFNAIPPPDSVAVPSSKVSPLAVCAPLKVMV